MFLCCGGSAAKKIDEEDAKHERPTTATSTRDREIDAVSDAPPAAVEPPRRVSQEMDYAKARREAEERELERTRSEISGLPSPRASTSRSVPPLRLSLGTDKRESSGSGAGFLGLLSPAISAPASPRFIEEETKDDEDDWARVVMESVSRAGSTYQGDKSRPVTPVVIVSDPEEKKQVPVPAAKVEKLTPETQEEKRGEKKEEKVEKKEEKVEKKEEKVEKTEEKAEEKVEGNKEEPAVEHTSLNTSADAAAANMDYNAAQAPPAPLPVVPVREHEGAEQKNEEPVEKEREPVIRTPSPCISIDSEKPHTSLYIPADAAAMLINYDAALAPPTPAASISDEDTTPKRGSLITPPPRSPSPAPSFAISERILNDKRASTISIVSTIAAAAASAALDRHAMASKRQSMLSTYSYTSFYSRPSSPAPPSHNRLSFLRGGTPTPRSGSPVCRLSVDSEAPSSGPSQEAQLLSYVSPLTNQVLPRLDKLLSTTSILSHYSRWETAMSLRRELRAFVASGTDEFLDDDGDVDNGTGLQMAVDAFVARGKAVIDAAADDAEDEAALGKGMFGDVRAFWAGGRGSGVVAV